MASPFSAGGTLQRRLKSFYAFRRLKGVVIKRVVGLRNHPKTPFVTDPFDGRKDSKRPLRCQTRFAGLNFAPFGSLNHHIALSEMCDKPGS
jgi:hypothetical protein